MASFGETTNRDRLTSSGRRLSGTGTARIGSKSKGLTSEKMILTAPASVPPWQARTWSAISSSASSVPNSGATSARSDMIAGASSTQLPSWNMKGCGGKPLAPVGEEACGKNTAVTCERPSGRKGERLARIQQKQTISTRASRISFETIGFHDPSIQAAAHHPFEGCSDAKADRPGR